MTSSDTAQIAETIIEQLGGSRALKLMTGVTNYVDIGDGEHRRGGVTFKMAGRNPPKCGNIVTVELNGRDLYDVTVSRMRAFVITETMKATDVYVENLRETVERGTGRVLTVPVIIRRD